MSASGRIRAEENDGYASRKRRVVLCYVDQPFILEAIA